MKYPHLKEEQQKQFDVPITLCGVSEKDKRLLLRECENMYVSNGVLRCREGFGENNVEYVYQTKIYDDIYKTLSFTDTTVEKDGETYRIATLHIGDGVSYVNVFVYLVSNKQIISVGNMHFNRVSSEEFYVPHIVKFVSGAKNKGCGIYAFVELIEENNYSRKYGEVFELSSDYYEWFNIYNGDFYCPVIYINGRGNLYDEIQDTVYPYAPIELEELNLMNSSFKAYFTSDGHSSVFQLPISNLDNENFICRVYSSPTEYTQWTVLDNSSQASATFNNVSVTLQIDRITGTFKFLSGGDDFPINKMIHYRGNNIEVLASKTVEGAKAAIFATKNCFAFNSHIYFYGDKENANKIFAARSQTPLYFPKNAVISVGNDISSVKCMTSLNDRLLAFKNNSIYSISVNIGNNYSSNELLINAGDTFYRGDSFKAKVINDRFGCVYKNTLCKTPIGLFWMGDKKQIYFMKSPSQISMVSQDIENSLISLSDEECEELSVEHFLNGIVIMCGSKAYVLQFEKSEPLWFNWKFPLQLKINDIANVNGVIKAAATVNSGETFVILELSGESDLVAYADFLWKSEPINFSFQTKNLSFDDELSLKVINTIILRLKYGDSFKAFLLDEEGRVQNSIYFKNRNSEKEYKNLKLRGNLCGVNSSALKVSGKGPFSLSKILYLYRNNEEFF